MKLLLRGRFSIGRNVNLGAGVVILSPDSARLADNVYIGRRFHAETNLEVHSDVLISSNVAVVGNDHRFDDTSLTVTSQGRTKPPLVILEGDNLVGFGTIIVGPVRIGRGCIIGAGSVVTRDLPPYTVCVGVPAKPIRDRFRSQ